MSAKKTKLLRKYASTMSTGKRFYRVMKKTYNDLNSEGKKEATKEALGKVRNK